MSLDILCIILFITLYNLFNGFFINNKRFINSYKLLKITLLLISVLSDIISYYDDINVMYVVKYVCL